MTDTVQTDSAEQVTNRSEEWDKDNGGGRREFVRNKKSFRMEKNKKHLRIIGDGNRVVITSNTGQVHIIGDGTSVWIVRNTGSVHFTGNHGRIFFGDQSEHLLVDCYVGSDGRVTVLKDSDMMMKIAERRTARKSSSEVGNCEKKKKNKSRKTKEGKEEVVNEKTGAPKEVVVKRDYLIPISFSGDDRGKKGSCCYSGFIQVTSELRIIGINECDYQI